MADHDPEPHVWMEHPDLADALDSEDERDENGPKFKAPHLEEGDGS